jgi:hypothetical protein
MATKVDKDLKTVLEKIGVELTRMRKAKGYTSHHSFSVDFDLPPVQYWRIEKGKANVTLKSLIRVLEIHGVDLFIFFDALKRKAK